MEILLNVGMALAGIFLFTIFKSKDFILANEFKLSVFIYENLKGFILSMIIVITIAIIIYFEPTANSTIKNTFGIDLENSKIGFLIFGIGINELVKKPSPRSKSARVRASKTVLK